ELAGGRVAHFARAVVVDGRAKKDRVDRVPRLDRVLEPPEGDDSHAASGDRSLRSDIKRPTTPVGRTDAALLVEITFANRDLDRSAASERDVAVKIEQALAGKVDGDQRCRACRSNRQARAGEVQLVGNARGIIIR